MFLVASLAGCALESGASPESVLSRAVQSAPAGAEAFEGVEWVRVPTPDGTFILAVVRPSGSGPFPVLVILHGTHGFAREYVRLAQDVAREGGVVAVAGCWFAGGEGTGRRFVTPIDCPDAPAISAHWSPQALASVSALVAAARELPGVRSDRVALFGHSRGGGGALHYVVERGGVRAAVINSAGYDEIVTQRVSAVSAPLLLLHGRKDGPADGTGGNAVTAFEKALAFESALRKAGKPVEAWYFDAHHNGLFTDATQYDETVRLVVGFVGRYVGD